MSNPEFHECCECNYRWRHGHDGSHSCVKNLQRQFNNLKAKTPICMEELAKSNSKFHQTHKRRVIQKGIEVASRCAELADIAFAGHADVAHVRSTLGDAIRKEFDLVK